MTDTILILDDHPDILDELSEFLSEEGFDVLTAESGKQLWALTKKTTINLFIIDLMLKGESGLTVTKELRARSEVGIIIVTGKSTETDRVVGLEIGADDYITKPFSAPELLARVRGVLRRTKGCTYPEKAKQPAGQEIAVFCDWQLDISAHHLTDPDGKTVDLTTAEFDLLRTFVGRPNAALARGQLLDAMHGQAWAGYNRGIDGLVSRLRRKLKARNDEPEYIKTVRSVGYLFTPRTKWL